MQKVMTELDSRQAYKREVYAPYYVCSYATHCFNLVNQKNEIYYESKRLPNMRLHCLFVSPAGYMKSYYLGTMGGDKYAIFKDAGIQIGYEQTLCLPAGQYVNMADGSHKNIEDVEVGDMVLHFDGNTFIPTEVTATHVMESKELMKITLEDGRNITLTPEHPLYTIHGWREPKNLRLGQSIMVPRKSSIGRQTGSNITQAVDNVAWIKIAKIEWLPGNTVYNISTADHTFVAQDIYTHNTEAGFIGTISNMNGVNVPTEGAAMTFRYGMLLIDEFSAITNAMKVQYNSQMDSQLLAALDHGNVYKRLGTGKIEYKTNLSLWAGVQPARYDLTSGMGRRMCFLLFLPTRYDNDQLMETMARTRNIRPDDQNMRELWRSINAWYNEMYKIERVEFDDSVLKVYKNMRLFSYESSYFDRLILGYHLATYGPEKHMHVTADNKELLEILQREKRWRDQIMQGVDFVQIERLIQTGGVPTDDGKYKITKRELVSEAIMVGWNAQQVHEMLIHMLKFGIISVKGNEVTLEM